MNTGKATLTLTFDLSDQDEKYEFERMIKARHMECALHDLMDELRSRVKYGEPNKGLEKFRDFAFKILIEHGIDLYD